MLQLKMVVPKYKPELIPEKLFKVNIWGKGYGLESRGIENTLRDPNGIFLIPDQRGSANILCQNYRGQNRFGAMMNEHD